MSALRVATREAPHIPFMFVSGTIGEERAINALKSGAVDYVLKENLARLAPAVRRALNETAIKAERVRQEAQIARLNRVLRMLSGVSGLVLRIRDRTELLRETCRLAVSVGGYTVAIASSRVPGFASIQPMRGAAWTMPPPRSCAPMSRSRCRAIPVSSPRPYALARNSSATTRPPSLRRPPSIPSCCRPACCRSWRCPLVVDGTVIALLVLTARDSDVVSEEELTMLREVAGNLSFGLQYLQRDTTARSFPISIRRPALPSGRCSANACNACFQCRLPPHAIPSWSWTSSA